MIEKHSRCDCENREVETQIAFDIERDRYLCKHPSLWYLLAICDRYLYNHHTAWSLV
jgi:hypothetical protein